MVGVRVQFVVCPDASSRPDTVDLVESISKASVCWRAFQSSEREEKTRKAGDNHDKGCAVGWEVIAGREVAL